MTKQGALASLNTVVDLLKSLGCDVVFVVADYKVGRTDEMFHTRLSVTDKPAIGVNVDHFVMDAVREISNNWSAVSHKKE